ncbi:MULTISPECIES: biopolymer transporter ExbD [unclassified Ectothiorhodospira]|uniref:ExbD/TolR family protein n=1 Tax=unclassified Ectothiorhodospira TaxID=2684909 RepID=UPI001EE7F286|nr:MULTISPECIES: biopolymer transporter ExbD [unclassified Ectothiorhodospira]MCG5515583.1 biopolymer transporter ExbD [Ectothiorhodospira sp. 9100]MCG5518742.1 biopolymer transporter ExbD [Ectothiorhodospira sp. 9905]
MSQRFDSINVIPFIDIMLVLLAIVLMTATFVVQGDIDVTLPVAQNSQEPEPELDAVRIGIDASASLFWQGKPIQLSDLDAELGTVAEQGGVRPVVLSVDESVSFGRFVEVVDLIKGHRLEKMSIRVQEGA